MTQSTKTANMHKHSSRNNMSHFGHSNTAIQSAQWKSQNKIFTCELCLMQTTRHILVLVYVVYVCGCCRLVFMILYLFECHSLARVCLNIPDMFYRTHLFFSIFQDIPILSTVLYHHCIITNMDNMHEVLPLNAANANPTPQPYICLRILTKNDVSVNHKYIKHHLTWISCNLVLKHCIMFPTHYKIMFVQQIISNRNSFFTGRCISRDREETSGNSQQMG